MGPTSCCRRCIVAAATVRRSRTVVLCTAPVVSTATKPSERQPRTVSCSPIPGFRCSFGAALLCSAHHAGAPSAHPPPTHRLRRHRPWQHCTTSATWQPVARTKPTTHPACKLGLHRWREGVEEARCPQHTPGLALADAQSDAWKSFDHHRLINMPCEEHSAGPHTQSPHPQSLPHAPLSLVSSRDLYVVLKVVLLLLCGDVGVVCLCLTRARRMPC